MFSNYDSNYDSKKRKEKKRKSVSWQITWPDNLQVPQPVKCPNHVGLKK